MSALMVSLKNQQSSILFIINETSVKTIYLSYDLLTLCSKQLGFRFSEKVFWFKKGLCSRVKIADKLTDKNTVI